MRRWKILRFFCFFHHNDCNDPMDGSFGDFIPTNWLKRAQDNHVLFFEDCKSCIWLGFLQSYLQEDTKTKLTNLPNLEINIPTKSLNLFQNSGEAVHGAFTCRTITRCLRALFCKKKKKVEGQSCATKQMSYKDSMSCLSMRTNVIVCPHLSAHLALTGPQVEEGWKVSRPRRAACDSSSGRVCQEESLYQDQNPCHQTNEPRRFIKHGPSSLQFNWSLQCLFPLRKWTCSESSENSSLKFLCGSYMMALNYRIL